MLKNHEQLKSIVSFEEWWVSIELGYDEGFEQGLTQAAWLEKVGRKVSRGLVRKLDPLMEVTPLMWAIEHHSTYAYRLIDLGVDVNQKVAWGETALMTAVKTKKIDVVQALIAAGANVDEEVLIESMNGGDLEAFKCLMEAGGDGLFEKEMVQKLFFNHSIKDLPDWLDFLIEKGVDVRGVEFQAFNLWMLAVVSHRRTLFSWLRRHQIDGENQQYEDGDTALIRAIASSLNETALALIHYDVDLNVQDKEGRTALHWAGKMEHRVLFQALIEKGADRRIKDREGKTAEEVGLTTLDWRGLMTEQKKELIEFIQSLQEKERLALLMTTDDFKNDMKIRQRL